MESPNLTELVLTGFKLIPPIVILVAAYRWFFVPKFQSNEQVETLVKRVAEGLASANSPAVTFSDLQNLTGLSENRLVEGIIEGMRRGVLQDQTVGTMRDYSLVSET